MDHNVGSVVGDAKAAIDEWLSSQTCMWWKPHVTSKFARGVPVLFKMLAADVHVEAQASVRVSGEVHGVKKRRVDMVEGLQSNPLVEKVL
jgi:hypothetical protein